MDGNAEAFAPEYPVKEAKRAYAIAGTALFVMIIAVQLSAVLVSVAARLLFPQLTETGWFALAMNFVCIYCIGAPLFLLIISRVKSEGLPRISMSCGKTAVASIISIGIIYLFNIVSMVIISVIEKLAGITVTSNLDAVLSSSSMWIAIVSTVVVAPIFEELLFRRMLCDRLARYGEWQAILFSGLAFSLFHTSIHQMLYAFFLGCFFAFIYVRTGKLRYTVCIHAVVNFIGSVPSLLLLKLGADEKLTWFGELLGAGDAEALVDFLADNWLIIALYLFYSFVLLTVVLVGIALGIAFLKRVIRGADGSLMPRGKRSYIMFSGIFTVLYVVVCILLAVAAMFM